MKNRKGGGKNKETLSEIWNESRLKPRIKIRILAAIQFSGMRCEAMRKRRRNEDS
jgi:hypothetical protein